MTVNKIFPHVFLDVTVYIAGMLKLTVNSYFNAPKEMWNLNNQ